MEEVSAKIIEEDRKATEAFRAVNASTFDGSDPDKIIDWIYELEGLFKACHVPERLYKTLAVTQLKGSALEWWIRKQGSLAHDNWTMMCRALKERYMGTTPEAKRKNRYLENWTTWQREFGETVDDYVERFSDEILKLAPPNENQDDLIWLFKKELSPTIRAHLATSLHLDSVEEVINETLELVDNLDIEEEIPEYIPMD